MKFLKTLFLLLTVLSFSPAFANNGNVDLCEINECNDVISSEVVCEDKATIDIHVEWGRSSKGCRGFGVCSIEIDIDIDIEFGTAKGNLELEGDVVVLKIDKKFLSPEILEQQFSRGSFVVGEDYVLSSKVSKELGMNRCIMREGEYDYEDHGEIFVLRFPQ